MPHKILITGSILNSICPNLTAQRAARIAELIDSIAPGYQMNDIDILHEFIAQVAHESGSFRLKCENLNYSAAGLLKTFGSKYFNTVSATKFARQPEKIANYVYGGRMGNNQPGDGWKYRGSGFIQITGKDMSEKYSAYSKNPDPDKLMECVRTDDWWAMDSACWLFAVEKGLIDEAINDDFKTITKKINGGYNGFQDRQWYYERAKKFLV